MKFEYGFNKEEVNVIKDVGIIGGWWFPKFKKKRGYELWNVEFLSAEMLRPTVTQLKGKSEAKKLVRKLMERFRKEEYPFTNENIGDWKS